jgi:chromate transporter
MVDSNQKSGTGSLGELALLFLKLGTTAFGGPAAHIAMMEEEVVRRRKWISHERFLDLLGATNLIPGPNSTEMAIHIGHLRAGWPGLMVAGICFIIPATMIVLSLAWVYVRFGKLPQAAGLLYGVKPVIIALVLQAIWGLGRAAVKTKFLALICLISIIFCFLNVNELILLFAAGAVMGLVQWLKNLQQKGLTALSTFITGASTVLFTEAVTGAGPVSKFGLWPLFLFFFKVGSVLFGSGYVLLAFLRADLVQRLGWLTEGQLLDAIAVGQVTPGPVFTTATFIGYILAGPWGALIATVGIFLPAFFFVAISGPLIPRLRKSAIAGAFLDGVNVASLALMAVVTWQLGRAAIVDLITGILAAASAILLIRFRLNSAWLVLIGAIIGLLIKGRI